MCEESHNLVPVHPEGGALLGDDGLSQDPEAFPIQTGTSCSLNRVQLTGNTQDSTT